MSPGPQPLSHPPGTLAAGAQIVPEYCLEKQLGKGGFGEVWKAIGPGKVPAALKIIIVKDSEAGQREFRSLDLLRDLRHPNLLPIQGYWLLDDAGQVINDDRPPSTLVIAMLLGGKNLRQRLSECQKTGYLGIPPDELLEYMRDAAKGIDFLNRPIHKLGDRMVAIQHRDIKPQNLMIVGGGLMVADFGIAGVMESTHVHTDHAAMTYAYAAPELFDHSASAWTDQYALAITYSQLRTGRLPFADNISSMQIMSVHMKGTHDFSGLSSPEIEVLKRATARVPEQRFANCLELVVKLEAAVQAADSAPTVHLSRDSDLRITSPKEHPAETAGTAAFTPSQSEGLHATKDSTRNKTVPVLSRETGRRNWLLSASISGIIVVCGLVAVLIAWQLGAFSPSQPVVQQPDAKGKSQLGTQSTGKEDQETKVVSGGNGNQKTAPAVPKTTPPSQEQMLQAARKKAAEAYQNVRNADVAPALDPVFQAQRQNAGDYSLRGESRLALAENGDSPEKNYRLAAADFADGEFPWEQSKALSRLGKWLQEHGQPKQAVEALQVSLKLQQGLDSPTIPEVQQQLCEAQLAAGDPNASLQGATDALRDLKLKRNSNQTIAARLHYVASKACLALAESTSPSPPEVRLQELDRLAEQHLQEAMALAESIPLKELAAWKNDLSLLRKLPRMIAREEMLRAETRIAELNKELEKTPDDPVRLLELAELEKKTRREKPAAAHFARGYSLRALELAGQGKLDDAAKAAAQAAQHDPDLALVHYAQGLVALQFGRPQEALPFLDAAVTKTPVGAAERWQYLATRGRTLAELAAESGTNQDWLRARADWEAAIAAFPNAAALLSDRSAHPVTAAHSELASLHFSLGSALRSLASLDARPDPALLQKSDQAFLKARTLEEKNAGYALAAGQSLLRHARTVETNVAASLLTEAGDLLHQALVLDPKLAAAHNALGECLVLQGQVAAAQAAFEKAVETGEKEPVAARFKYYLNLCDAYLRQPRNDAKALAAAERAVALDEKNAEGHFHRGLALRNLVRNADAVAAFDEALVHQPKHVFALLAKSKLIVDADASTQRQLDQADRDIEKAFAAATTVEQKAEAYYVRSLASLKSHLGHLTDRAIAEPALLKTERDLLQAVTTAPSNGIYAKTAAELFIYAASYACSDSQRQAENDQLQQDWKKLKKTTGLK